MHAVRTVWVFLLTGFVAGVGVGYGAPKRSAVADRWVSEIALDELGRAAKEDGYNELAGRIEKVIAARLACGSADELETLTDLVYMLRACEYLPIVDEIESDRVLSTWLLGNPSISRRLFRALGDVGSVEVAVEKLKALWEADAKAVVAYPDLTVAFATSGPVHRYGQDTEPASLIESFRWYMDPRRSFRYDLKKMPYELSRYLADTRLLIGERRWAVANYGRHARPAKAYFDLVYDTGHFERGEPKKISRLPYTLPNLRKVGGVCVDQAYFASEVCKALGMPAAVLCIEATEVLMGALGKAESMLLAADRRDVAIQMYSDVFERAKRTRRRLESAFRRQTTYYQVRMRLVDLLREAGNDRAAKRILAEISDSQ